MITSKKVIIEQVGDCQICTSHKAHKDGYIRITHKASTERMHRVVWKREKGEIPDGMNISHTCGDNRCMNVAHMEMVNVQQRAKKMVANGNSCKGIKSNRHKLTEEQVIKIVNDKSRSNAQIADLYDMSESHIRDLKGKRYWKHLWVGDGRDETRTS